VEAIITHLISRYSRAERARAAAYYQDARERGTHNPRAAADHLDTHTCAC